LDFDEAIKLNPTSPLAFSNRCFARGVLDQLEQGLADCRQSLRWALKLEPLNLDIRETRGFIYLKLGDPALALHE
jgi:hypothetical protein